MNRIFCPNCGAKHEFSLAAPNFCSKCGQSMKSLAVASSNLNEQVRQTRRRESIIDEQVLEDETIVDEVPAIARLEVETHSGSPRSITLGDILKNPTPPDISRKRTMSVDEFIDDRKQ